MKTVKVTGHPRLYRRGGRYYHRAAIPQDIRDSYPKAEETFSLKTSDYQEALRRVRQAAAEVDRRFAEHRQRLALTRAQPLDGLTDSQIQHLATIYEAQLLEGDEQMRERLGRGDAQDPYVHSEVMEEHLANARSAYAMGTVAKHVSMASFDLLEQEDLQLSSGSPSWHRLGRILQEAFIKAGEAMEARDAGKVIPTPTAPETLAPKQVASGSSGPLLSTAAEDWMAEKARTWTKKTANDHRSTIDSFITITGDKPLGEYGKADGRAFKAVLMRLPANWSKQKALRGLTIDRAAARAHELGMSPMSDKNVNKLIGYAAAFWNWAIAHYDNCPSNPLVGLKVKLKQRARDERDPFNLAELQAIFQAPVFTGCKSLRFWRQQGHLVPRDSGMFWVPLISLFSGARMGEILQLYTSDIKQEDDITYLDINGDGEDKSLKTASSWRVIPVHPELVKLGFLEHVTKMKRRGSKRLFPDMPMGEDGYYSSVYSKRFRQLLESLGIKHNKNAFHSFRHNFEDACRNSGISLELINALQGHAGPGMSGRYGSGSGFDLQTLNESITRLHYRGLDISSLHLSPAKQGTYEG